MQIRVGRNQDYPRWLDQGIGTLREVAPGLYVGSENARGYAGFEYAVDLYGSKVQWTVKPPITRVLPINDCAPIPPATLDIIWHDVLTHRGPALVACQAGLSRSASVTYALLRRATGMGHAEALRRVLIPGVVGYPDPTILASARAWVHARR